MVGAVDLEINSRIADKFVITLPNYGVILDMVLSVWCTCKLVLSAAG